MDLLTGLMFCAANSGFGLGFMDIGDGRLRLGFRV